MKIIRLIGSIYHVFWGSMFLIGGLLSIFLGGKKDILECTLINPSQVTCQLTSSSLGGKEITQIEQLQAARVITHTSQSSRPTGGSSTSYQILLQTKNQGSVGLVSTSDKSDTNEKVERINGFIDSPSQKSLKLTEENYFVAYLIGGVFMLVGGLVVLNPFYKAYKRKQERLESTG